MAVLYGPSARFESSRIYDISLRNSSGRQVMNTIIAFRFCVVGTRPIVLFRSDNKINSAIESPNPAIRATRGAVSLRRYPCENNNERKTSYKRSEENIVFLTDDNIHQCFFFLCLFFFFFIILRLITTVSFLTTFYLLFYVFFSCHY